ncbi:MAG: peptidylprolyl isomerase [Acidobacteriota bacterium]|nr:peptidylprolyl isomerase [Acidobacteriota bacterium]
MRWELWALCALAAGCGRPVAPAPDVVAHLGDRELTYADFESYLRLNSLDSEVGLASGVLSGLFDQFLREELLLETARAEGLEGADRRRLVDRLIGKRAAQAVTEADVAGYYEGHAAEFDLPERVSLRQILLDDRRLAVAALERLRAGEPFEAVARSVEPGADVGGWEQADLARDGVPPAFAEAIFSLAPGAISEIVEADYGFFIFEVTGHQPAERLRLEQAAPRIRSKLEREAADKALSELVGEAERRYNVAVFEQNLPFDYRGNYRPNAASP